LLGSLRHRSRPLHPELEHLLHETALRADAAERAVWGLALGVGSPPRALQRLPDTPHRELVDQLAATLAISGGEAVLAGP